VDAMEDIRGLTSHASRVNGTVSVAAIPRRFTYLCWNIPQIYVVKNCREKSLIWKQVGLTILILLTQGVNNTCGNSGIMDITFINKKLEKLLSTQKELLRTFGPDNGKRIGRRLQNIADASNLAELAKLPQTRVHELSGDRDEQISVDVKHPYRLLLASDHEQNPRKQDGGLDWERISKVKVLEIEDTH
jgi:plasmid maintenance system killer protein